MTLQRSSSRASHHITSPHCDSIIAAFGVFVFSPGLFLLVLDFLLTIQRPLHWSWFYWSFRALRGVQDGPYRPALLC